MINSIGFLRRILLEVPSSRSRTSLDTFSDHFVFSILLESGFNTVIIQIADMHGHFYAAIASLAVEI